MTVKSKTLTSIKWSGINTLSVALFQIMQIAWLTRFLTKDDFGLVAMTMVVVTFVVVCVELGLYAAILHCQNATREESSSIFWLNIVNALVLYAALYLLTPLIAAFYGENELNHLIPVLGIHVLLIALGGQHKITMQKEFRFKTLCIIDTTAYFVGMVVSVTAAINGMGPYSMVFGTLSTSFIVNIAYFVQNLKVNPLRFYFKLKDIQRYVTVAFYNLGNNLLDFFSREIDIVIIGKVLGAETLGLYSLAKQVVMKIYTVFNPIILNVLNPLLASVQSDLNTLRMYLLQAVRLNALINIPIYLMIVILSEELLTLLFGPNYSLGYVVLAFLAISYVSQSIGSPSISLQIATGKTYIGLRWTFIRIAITPIVIFLASAQGINAVAISLAVISVLLLIPHWWMQYKAMAGIRLKEYCKQFVRPFSAFAIITALFYVFGVYIFGSLAVIPALLGKLTTGVVLYLALMWWIDRESMLHLKTMLVNRKITIQ